MIFVCGFATHFVFNRMEWKWINFHNADGIYGVCLLLLSSNLVLS